MLPLITDKKQNTPFSRNTSKTKTGIDISNSEYSVEDTTLSGVFLTSFQMFGNVVKHCLSVRYIFSSETKTN